jgi:hypothetical protein
MRVRDLRLLSVVLVMPAAPVVAGQMVIDMPPPPAKSEPAQTAEADSGYAEDGVSLGEIALRRYRYARVGASDTYAWLPPFRRYGGYSFYGPSWYWDPCWGSPFGGSPFVWRGFRFSWSGSTFQSRDAGGGG